MIDISGITNLIGKFVPDVDKAKELEAKIKETTERSLQQAIQSDKEIRLAELNSGGLNAVWRPIAALLIFAILGLRWLIYPLIMLIRDVFNLSFYMPMEYDLPDNLYLLATAFVSIYAYGRSIEKRFK